MVNDIYGQLALHGGEKFEYHAPPILTPPAQAASLYERAVNIEETAERHVFLGEALVLAERKGEALWHYGRAADLYDDREYKVRTPRFCVNVAT